MTKPVLIMIMIACLGLSACNSSEPVEPAYDDVQLVLSLSKDTAKPGEVVLIEAKVLNMGNQPVFHADGCSFTNGMAFQIVDSNGVPFSNGRPLPMCPDGCCRELAAGEVLVGKHFFDGKIYGEVEGGHFTPAGEYTVTVWFVPDTTTMGTVVLQESKTITWSEAD